MDKFGLGGLTFAAATPIIAFVIAITMAISDSRPAKNKASFCSTPRSKAASAVLSGGGPRGPVFALEALAHWRRLR